MSLNVIKEHNRQAIPLHSHRAGAPGIARVLVNERLTPADHDEVRHIVLDVDGLGLGYREGQSLGILAPGIDSPGRRHKPWLYPIASTRRGDDGRGRTVSLCVKRRVDRDPATSLLDRAVTSHYLCDLEPGATVAVTGPAGKTFLLPDDPASNLILVATGTGIAPFRAFLRRIYLERPEWTIPVVNLFFGTRTVAECLYREELESFLDYPGFHLTTAFSREHTTQQGRRLYVQDRIAEQMGSLWDLLEREDTYLYISGLWTMAHGVDALLAARAEAEGVSWGPYRNELVQAGRIKIETY